MTRCPEAGLTSNRLCMRRVCASFDAAFAPSLHPRSPPRRPSLAPRGHRPDWRLGLAPRRDPLHRLRSCWFDLSVSRRSARTRYTRTSTTLSCSTARPTPALQYRQQAERRLDPWARSIRPCPSQSYIWSVSIPPYPVSATLAGSAPPSHRHSIITMQIPLVRFAIAFGSGLLIAGVGCAPMQPDHLSGNQNTAKREVTTGSSVEDALQRRQVQARDEYVGSCACWYPR